MKKILNIVLKLLGIIAFFALIPPLVNWIVSKPSVIGFITLDKQEIWINFYGALIGGMLTLLGVGWTIKHTDSLNKEEQRKREQEIKEEYNRRDIETKKFISTV